MKWAAVALVLVACGGAPAVSRPTGLTPGDYVVYRFTQRGATVDLTEQVLARDRGKLIMDVALARQGAQRHLVKVVPDVGDALWSGTAVELYSVAPDGTSTRVPGDGPTLLRAYEWVETAQDGAPRASSLASCPSMIHGGLFACSCESVTVKTTRMESRRCPAFPWQRGPARWSDTVTGTEVWRADVVDVGHGRPAASGVPDLDVSAVDPDDDPLPLPAPMPVGATWAGDYTSSAGGTLHLDIEAGEVRGRFRPAPPAPATVVRAPATNDDIAPLPDTPPDICGVAPEVCVGVLREGWLAGRASGDVLRFGWVKQDVVGNTTRGEGHLLFRSVGPHRHVLLGVCDGLRFRWSRVDRVARTSP